MLRWSSVAPGVLSLQEFPRAPAQGRAFMGRVPQRQGTGLCEGPWEATASSEAVDRAGPPHASKDRGGLERGGGGRQAG
eukprot:9998868-Alexandrium_andersonii.AAC.1